MYHYSRNCAEISVKLAALSTMVSTKAKIALVLALGGAAIFLFAANYFNRKRKRAKRQKPLKEVPPQRALPSLPDSTKLRIHRRAPSSRSPTVSRGGPGSTSSAGSGLSRRSGVTSPVGEQPPTTENLTSQHLFQLGMESLEQAVQRWEEAIHLTPQSHQTELDKPGQISNAELNFRLERLLKSAYGVQTEAERTLSLQSSLASSQETIALSLTDSNRTLIGEFSDDESTESFVSASELAELDDITEFKTPESRMMYIEAMNAVADDLVICRKLRTNLLNCRNDIDFLAKLHCVRQAFDHMLMDPAIVDWFIDLGRQMMGDLIITISQDAEDFYEAYDCLIDFVRNKENWQVVEEELVNRRVRCINFYDIVLDFTLMDAFDDMERLPASVAAIAQNRWLSYSVKQTAMSNAIWSLIAIKRRMLNNPEGFLGKFYNLSAAMSPALCWGFLGPSDEFRKICYYFKDQVIKVLRDMFNLSAVRYSNVSDLSDDILATIRDNAMLVDAILKSPKTQ
ncbi:mitoguardin 2-like isoform X2 [Ptychodera flava]|uniref:mitoguardin 2-like isoform X2 n=1 Tax=Ptychodera flava TaxID=63121 RepID=UPI003969FEDA